MSLAYGFAIINSINLDLR